MPKRGCTVFAQLLRILVNPKGLKKNQRSHLNLVKPVLLNRKPLENEKLRKNERSPWESSMIANCFLSEIRGSIKENKLEKSRS